MIRLTGVTKTYSDSAKPKQVLANVSLTVGKGDFFYVVGDSGAGKTTLLKLIYGEETPSRGAVDVFGESLQQNLQKFRARMGIVFQDFRLVDELTAYDNVALAYQIQRHTNEPTRKAVEDALAMVQLSDLSKNKVSLLSGGEKQRLAVARAIVHKPDIILADEPTGSLDREHTWGLMDLFQKLHFQGTTVLLATHDREIVRRVRRKACVLSAGKLMMEDGLCMF